MKDELRALLTEEEQKALAWAEERGLDGWLAILEALAETIERGRQTWAEAVMQGWKADFNRDMVQRGLRHYQALKAELAEARQSAATWEAEALRFDGERCAVVDAAQQTIRQREEARRWAIAAFTRFWEAVNSYEAMRHDWYKEHEALAEAQAKLKAVRHAVLINDMLALDAILGGSE